MAFQSSPKRKRYISLFPAFVFAAIAVWMSCSEPVPDVATPASQLLNRVTNAYPAFSPDGDWVAYMSTADGDFDVYAVSPSRGERRQLTNAAGRDGTPAWSPDGSQIAFQSFRDGHSQLFIMNADGSGQRNISNNQWHDEHPFWSSDGEWLLFASNRSATAEAPDNIDLFQMRIDSGDVQQITDTPQVETYPSWSPDGTQIAARQITEEGNWEVVIMEANGLGPRVVASHPAADGWPIWSPDGHQLAFASERAGTADLYLFDLEAETLRRLTWDDEADERQPWFSPDGRHVVYARYVWFPDQPFYEASEIHIVAVAP